MKKLTQKQIDEYLEKIVNRPIRLPKHNPELKKKLLVPMTGPDEEDGERIALTKNLASKEGMKRSMALMKRLWKWEKKHGYK